MRIMEYVTVNIYFLLGPENPSPNKLWPIYIAWCPDTVSIVSTNSLQWVSVLDKQTC